MTKYNLRISVRLAEEGKEAIYENAGFVYGYTAGEKGSEEHASGLLLGLLDELEQTINLSEFDKQVEKSIERLKNLKRI